jgi:hypothetical protein
VKLLIYAGDEYMTGDDIALALLKYSEALADNETAESVEIPILEADGTRQSAIFLLGPASQIVAKNVDSGHDELLDPAAVEQMQARTRALRPVGMPITPITPNDDSADWIDAI